MPAGLNDAYFEFEHILEQFEYSCKEFDCWYKEKIRKNEFGIVDESL